MKIHFIAIGGAAMHNLAIALHVKGYSVSGSDDEIFEPAKSNLQKIGILPEKQGWFPDKITGELDAIILGMHAKADNPELMKANSLGIKIYSFPEYLYEQTKQKIRVVIGGSHGKTSVTAMILHVLKHCNIKFDFMVGAHINGFETMVELNNDSKIAVFEGDEYLSSAIDRRSKFILYQPTIALLNGIAWDHINVFNTFESYLNTFRDFLNCVRPEGTIIYYQHDEQVKKIIEQHSGNQNCIPFGIHESAIENGQTYLIHEHQKIPIKIFGDHNMQNICGALSVCTQLNIPLPDFYKAIQSFSGAAKRLQIIAETQNTTVFSDFAHSPSKLKATVQAVKKQFPERKLYACMELHTFSSLNQLFLTEYSGTMNDADEAVVFYNPKTLEHKGLSPIDVNDIISSFGRKDLIVFSEISNLKNYFQKLEITNSNVLLMSSGNFAGLDILNLLKMDKNKIVIN